MYLLAYSREELELVSMCAVCVVCSNCRQVSTLCAGGRQAWPFFCGGGVRADAGGLSGLQLFCRIDGFS